MRAAFADERIPAYIAGEKDFDRLLHEASERPNDRGRLADEGMGTIEDVLAELEAYPAWNDSGADEMTDDALLEWAAEDRASRPFHNPHRGIGRNDPCPCGSGKKFKKCCLRQSED